MSQHFLDGAQVCATLDEVGGETVTERVGTDVLANASSHDAALQHGESHLTRHLASLSSEEQRVFVSLLRNDIGPVVAEVIVDAVARLLPNGNHPLFVALANHAHQTVDEVHFGQLEVNQFRHTQSTAVQHLQHGLVPHTFAAAHVHGADDAFDFFNRQHIWKFALWARGFDQLNGIRVHDALDAEVLAEAADPAEHAGLTVACQPTVVEVAKEPFHMGKLNVHGGLDALFVHRELHELLDVAHVRHHGILAQPAFKGEVIVIALNGRFPICGAR